MERAKSIVEYLISKGIPNERLVAKGYGAEEPIEDNNTEEGRQKNDAEEEGQKGKEEIEALIAPSSPQKGPWQNCLGPFRRP